MDNPTIKRLFSFLSGWPIFNKPSLFAMAEAGFTYLPSQDYIDLVHCYQCKLDFFHWDSDENPFKAHAQASPTCPFVLSTQLANQIEHPTEPQPELQPEPQPEPTPVPYRAEQPA